MRHATTRTPILVLSALVLLAVPRDVVCGQDAPEQIAWVNDLPTAFAAATEQDKPLMICINASHVDGGRREPAAKELREKTYKHPDVVALSKGFVCTFITSEGSSDDYGEMRLRYGIDGYIISPQHVFAYPDGKLIFRREYWPYGYGQKAVDSLLKMMNDALTRDRDRRSGVLKPRDSEDPGDGADDVPVAEAPEVDPAPEDGEERAKWIEVRLRDAQGGDRALRRASLNALVGADRDGDTVGPVLELLDDMKKRPLVQIDIVRALGRPGLEVAAKPIAEFLTHKEMPLRANAAVSLEYIGSEESVSSLMKRAPKEKDENVANHMYRALGRCGAGQAKVRSLLAKKVLAAKTNESSYGPIIALAYFEDDPKAAREVEKLIKKEGMPGGRRNWRGGLKRALLAWCLTEVGFGNEKSAKFLREDVIPMIPENRWSETVTEFYRKAAEVCDGDEGARADVDDGVRRAIGRSSRSGWNPLMGDARRDRSDAGFEPKGEWQAGQATAPRNPGGRSGR